MGVFCEPTSHYHPQHTCAHVHARAHTHTLSMQNGIAFLVVHHSLCFQHFSRYGSQTQGAPYTCLQLETTLSSKHRLLFLTANKKIIPPRGVKQKRTNPLFGNILGNFSPSISNFSLTIHSCTTCISFQEREYST